VVLISIFVIIVILSQICFRMKALKLSFNKAKQIFFVLGCFFLLTLINCNNSQRPEEKKSKEAIPGPASSALTKENKGNPPAGINVSMDSIQTLLKGKWLRSDGTYTIEIFSVTKDGRMDAGYFNPNPINVGSSGWDLRDGVILMEIVLKDANYPGSKYNLIYDRNSGCLAGNYFQAVQGINYDVIFVRKK
jgi:hypothetical protein